MREIPTMEGFTAAAAFAREQLQRRCADALPLREVMARIAAL